MAGGARLPGADDAEEQIVCHVDMDCFYAACERLREPVLRDSPVVIGMGYEADEPHGAVATASYEAREFGVESAMAISSALERLPRMADAEVDPDIDESAAGYYRPVDMDFYASVSADVRAILDDIADVVREVSIDEAYLDITERTDWATADAFGQRLADRIAEQVGVAASVGMAPTMSAAKIASDHDKPNGLVVVPPGEVESFLAPLEIEDLHGIGPVTAAELRGEGITTIGDLATADGDWLADRFGDRGRELYQRARGIDRRSVTPTGRPKSLSRESAFSETVEDFERKRETVRELAAAVADRAQRKGAMYRTIGIKVVEPPFDINTRERSLSGPVDDPELLEAISIDLLREFDEAVVRKVGVRVSNLSFADHDQARLDGWDGGGSIEHDRPLPADPRGQTTLWEFAER